MFYDVARVAGVAFVERTRASYAPDHVTRIRNICQSLNELETSRIVWTTMGLLERFSFVPLIRRKEGKMKDRKKSEKEKRLSGFIWRECIARCSSLLGPTHVLRSLRGNFVSWHAHVTYARVGLRLLAIVHATTD